MEKLIELLNEYEIWKGKNGLDITQQYAEHNFKYNKWLYIRVISKKFGFIKWLVENDKINKDLISRVLIRAYISPKTMVSLECEFHDYYESLLMLLSISDTPIEDLLLYLK